MQRTDLRPAADRQAERPKSSCFASEKFRNRIRACVSNLKPDDLGWRPFEETPLSEIVVLRDDHVTVVPRMVPDQAVSCTLETSVAHVDAPGVLVSQESGELRTHVLIEKELHAAGLERRRSRAAANARHARISSPARSGKSARISLSLMPPAMYSSTS